MKSSAGTLIFRENCSTRRCVVLMAVVGGGELHVLLVHHLHLCPGSMTFIVMVRFLSLWFICYKFFLCGYYETHK